MKILNLYAGIGGNRKLWGDEEVTAIEIDKKIAEIYQDNFPGDTVIVMDAHEFLEVYIDERWDFIWSSPPCPTHSKIRNIAGVGRGQDKPVYPDMKLYEEIIFLNQAYHTSGSKFNGKYCVENVKSYYEPLIKPYEIGRHFVWSNFEITQPPGIPILAEKDRTNLEGLSNHYGIDLTRYAVKEKIKTLRNCVHPKIGKHIFDCAFKYEQNKLTEYQGVDEK